MDVANVYVVPIATSDITKHSITHGRAAHDIHSIVLSDPFKCEQMDGHNAAVCCHFYAARHQLFSLVHLIIVHTG